MINAIAIRCRENKLNFGSERCQQIQTLHKISTLKHVTIAENATFQAHA